MNKLPQLTGLELMTIETDWGWVAAVGQNRLLYFLTMGHPDMQCALNACGADSLSDLPEPRCWNPKLKKLLLAYASGKNIDFSGIKIAQDHLTPFQKNIVSCCRKIPYSKTITYGELARRAGSPGAARAAGSVMAKNRFPLIVPCHRVVAAGGKLGGFSVPTGPSLKQQLLDLEAKAGQSLHTLA